MQLTNGTKITFTLPKKEGLDRNSIMREIVRLVQEDSDWDAKRIAIHINKNLTSSKAEDLFLFKERLLKKFNDRTNTWTFSHIFFAETKV